MYLSFYRLTANPFRLAPDHRFFFASAGHKKGLAYLQYGLQQGQGFVVVTGLPGTGKSTLVQTLFADLRGRPMVLANLASPSLEAEDILVSVACHFDVYKEGLSKAGLILALENFLAQQVRAGKQVLLIVDEAQNLPNQSLEELRMLSNFYEGEKPLIQIMLVGQEQLQQKLADPELEQLTQRIIASCNLKPLGSEETRAYIEHRLQCAGWRGNPEFSAEALAYIYAVSGGVPRLINIFCDRLLLSASLDDKHQIDIALVRELIDELRLESTGLRVEQVPGADTISAMLPLPDQKTRAAWKREQIVHRANQQPQPKPQPTAAHGQPHPQTHAAHQAAPQTKPESKQPEFVHELAAHAEQTSAKPDSEQADKAAERDDTLQFKGHSDSAPDQLLVSKKLLWGLVTTAAVVVTVLVYLLLTVK